VRQVKGKRTLAESKRYIEDDEEEEDEEIKQETIKR